MSGVRGGRWLVLVLRHRDDFTMNELDVVNKYSPIDQGKCRPPSIFGLVTHVAVDASIRQKSICSLLIFNPFKRTYYAIIIKS